MDATLDQTARCRIDSYVVLPGWSEVAPRVPPKHERNVERRGASGLTTTRRPGEYQKRATALWLVHVHAFAGRALRRAGGARVRRQALHRSHRRTIESHR